MHALATVMDYYWHGVTIKSVPLTKLKTLYSIAHNGNSLSLVMILIIFANVYCPPSHICYNYGLVINITSLMHFLDQHGPQCF